MHLHAATTVDGRDRQQLERLSRNLLRPPFANDAVQALEGGRVRVHFKAPWRRGIAHADMDADKFLARLCALVPPPGFHMVRYFGVLASHHHLRPRVVPGPGAELPGQQLTLAFAGRDSAEPDAVGKAVSFIPGAPEVLDEAFDAVMDGVEEVVDHGIGAVKDGVEDLANIVF